MACGLDAPRVTPRCPAAWRSSGSVRGRVAALRRVDGPAHRRFLRRPRDAQRLAGNAGRTGVSCGEEGVGTRAARLSPRVSRTDPAHARGRTLGERRAARVPRTSKRSSSFETPPEKGFPARRCASRGTGGGGTRERSERGEGGRAECPTTSGIWQCLPAGEGEDRGGPRPNHGSFDVSAASPSARRARVGRRRRRRPTARPWGRGRSGACGSTRADPPRPRCRGGRACS